MKLLLDQGLPRSTAALLRNAGIETVHVGELGLATADDPTILDEGRQADRVVVTLDADFHALLARSGAIRPSVIRIRIEGLRADTLATLLTQILTRCGPGLEAGAVVSVQPGRLRLRRLPLLR